MKFLRVSAVAALILMLLTASCGAELLESLPMNKNSGGPEAKLENCEFANDEDEFCAKQEIHGLNYISAKAYRDESISVEIHTGRNFDTDYVFAHVKIKHPSQLRTVSAAKSSFTSTQVAHVREMAKDINAVIAINGDYAAKPEKCKVLLRQSRQVRNSARGDTDLLIVDTNGDFSILEKPTRQGYAKYYNAHEKELYQVFCFGPVLVKDGVSVVSDDYKDGYRGSDNNAQRSAIAQLGPLEYMLISTGGPQIKNNKGLTIQEFSIICEEAGKALKPEGGCQIAYNLDGGNSALMSFIGKSTKSDYIRPMKISPGAERQISDIIYFATLEK